MRSIPICAALLLAGCFTIQAPVPQKGQYTNCREFAYSQMKMFSWQGVPAKTQDQMRTCMVDAIYPNYTPAEVDRLNAYARGENQMSAGELQTMDREIGERMGGPKGAAAALMTICPDTIREMQKYPDAKPAVPLVVSR